MFYTLAILSMLGYALQNILLVRFARTMDGMSLGFYRNISFTLTLLPLLIGSHPEEVRAAFSYWPIFLMTSICGGITLTMRFGSYRYVPVAVSHSMTSVGLTILLIGLAWFFFQETVSAMSVVLITVILLGIILLGFERGHLRHFQETHVRGITMSVIAALPLALTHFGLIIVARDVSPLVSGYIWEVGIGVMTFVILILRRATMGIPIARINDRTFAMIAACSVPTLIGTACYVLAVSMGSIAIVSAIGAAGLSITALLTWWMYGERMNWKQWIAIAIIIFGIVLLKLL